LKRRAAQLVGAGLVLSGAFFVLPAQNAVALPGCGAANIYVNTPTALNVYSPTGSLVSTAPLSVVYGDIAFNAAGTVLYGIRFTSTPTLDTINLSTGAVLTSTVLTGPVATAGTLNALSGLPNGDLLAGSGGTTTLYELNPANGTSTIYAAALPAGHTSAGDFLTLGDGDILAVTNGTGVDDLVRIHPNNSTTIVGTVASSYGAAQSGGAIYLAGADGVIRELAAVPTAASTSPLTTTTVVSTGLALYGATSVQDSGQCNVLAVTASPATTPYGHAVTLGQSGLATGSTGTVTFVANGTTLCTVTLPAASCTTPGTLSPGTYAVTATYSGTNETATTSFVVAKAAPSLTSPPTTNVPAGTAKTLSVSGIPAGATGHIVFVANGITLCTATLPSASCTAPSDLAAGAYTVTASYSGDANYDPATSTFSFTVDAASALARTGTRLSPLIELGTAALLLGSLAIAIASIVRRRTNG
jgi:hypothetical protein